MTTSDGVRLDADVWTPAGEGPWPVLLMRQAYGRRIGSSLCYAHPSWYAQQGFLVVIQDVRGRGTSEGKFTAFENEGRDGAETIEWAARLPGSNGRVGMFGFSYQGTNQLLAAAAKPPALRAMAPAMIGWDLFADWATEDGAFRLASNINWGVQMAAGTAAHGGDAAAWREFYAASRALPLQSPVNARPAVLDEKRDLGHYHQWVERPHDDPYWSRISPAPHADLIRDAGAPALFIGGWFDTHLPGTLVGFDALAGSGAKLLVGPWTHFPWDRHVGDCDFGPEAVTAVDTVQVRWFRRWLTDDASTEPEPALRLFDMGASRWRERESWPEGQMILHLEGNGLASVDSEAGRLLHTSAGQPVTDYIVHDPWRPAPSVGGAFGTPSGPVDRVKTDSRSDILTFTTAELDAPLPILGAVNVSLSVVSDAPSFDIACVLSRIAADGQVLQIAEGFRSIEGFSAGDRISISLRRACATIDRGERLRLSIAAACFPAYPVNPGTGQKPTEATRDEARPITLGIVTGGDKGSTLSFGIDDESGVSA